MKPAYLYDSKIVELTAVSAYKIHEKPLLSPSECAQVGDFSPSDGFLAKRIAAKEALFSCLSQLDIQWDDYSAVSILHDHLGKPYFSFSEDINDLLRKNNVASALLSIADEKCRAFAYVVINFLVRA